MITNNATPPAWTAQGVHEDLITCIKKYASKGSSVLDLGAGAGALSLKLANAGYAVSAADWMIESYMPENIEIKKIDLDSKESILESYPSNSFDFLVACEVIEHLKYPWQFIESCSQLIKDNGYFFLTTPNILERSSRVNILANGWPISFGEKSREEGGHISPLFPAQVINMFSNCQLNVIKTLPIGRYSRFKLPQYNTKGFILLLFANVLSPLMVKGNKKGNVVLFVGVKNSSSRTEQQRPLGTGIGDAYILKC